MNKVYILEYKGNTSPISRIIKFFTREKYSHTAMMINEFFCELSPLDKLPNENDYHVRNIPDLNNFIEKNRDIDLFEVKHEFNTEQIDTMLKFWIDRADKDINYGYEKLLFLPWSKIALKLMRYYWRRKGKPYPMKSGIWRQDVCSTAVDHCLKAGGLDLFPEYSERVIYPGLYSKRLKDSKIT